MASVDGNPVELKSTSCGSPCPHCGMVATPYDPILKVEHWACGTSRHYHGNEYISQACHAIRNLRLDLEIEQSQNRLYRYELEKLLNEIRGLHVERDLLKADIKRITESRR